MHWHRARSADSIDAYVRTIVVRTFLSEQRLRWAKVRLTSDTPQVPSPPGREVETRMVVDAALGRIPAVRLVSTPLKEFTWRTDPTR